MVVGATRLPSLQLDLSICESYWCFQTVNALSVKREIFIVVVKEKAFNRIFCVAGQ